MKTVIITGGNSGLGYEAAKVFALDGNWHIVIASRSEQRMSEAVAQLKSETGYFHISSMVLDLASLASVRAFVAQFAETSLPPLHGIVCNAGLQTTWTKTVDGIDSTFGINHLGHFLLVNLLLKYLQKPGRIIFVSSGTHLPEKRMPRWLGVPAPKYLTARDLAYPDVASEQAKMTNPRQAYSTSKLCNVLCAYELSRRLQDEGYSTDEAPVGVYAFDPGLMPGTGFLREVPEFIRNILTGIIKMVEPLVDGISLPEQSGRELFHLVTDDRLNGQSALYFDGDKAISSSADSYNRAFQRDLWETSVELSGLQASETILALKDKVLA